MEATAAETLAGDMPQPVWEATGVEQKQGEQVGIGNT